MKVVKYILAGLFILGGVGSIPQEASISGLFSILLGIVLLPPVSDYLKEKFPLYQNNQIRFLSCFIWNHWSYNAQRTR